MRDGEFSDSSFEKAYTEIYGRLTADADAVSSPKAYILGGQSGAGKTMLQRMMSKQCGHDLIIINGDEFRRYHPDFHWLQQRYGKDSVAYTNAFSGRMTEALISRLKTQGYNILVEGTLRTAETPLKTCKDFKESGYDVTLAVLAVKPEISYISTIKRYEDMLALDEIPRATPKASHDLIVHNLPSNLDTLYNSSVFDDIVIYNRSKECLYDMAKADTSPKETMSNALFGKWSQSEFEQYLVIGAHIQYLMYTRDAPELSDFQSQYFNLKLLKELADKNSVDFSQYLDFSEYLIKTHYMNIER